ncbi:MAG: hypothetical protein IPJ98_18515 [Bryobacterales bacterium]|nr:hypothetical protein [Bryobacterales bacterium]
MACEIRRLRYDALVNGGADKTLPLVRSALNCFPLQDEVHTLESSGWKLTFSRIPTQLDLNAPITSPFSIPTSYREAPPSEHQKAEIARKRGAPFGSHPNDAALENTFQRLDRHYHESQQFKPHQ